MNPNCNTCNHTLADGVELFVCLTCGNSMLWTLKCTGFSETLLKELKEVRNNVLLMCNQCSSNGKRDLFFSVVSRQSSAIEAIQKQIEKAENSLKTQTEVELKKYSEVLTNTLATSAAPHPLVAATKQDVQKKSTGNALIGIRIRGIPELVNRDPALRFKADQVEVNKIFSHLGLACQASDIKRMGNHIKGKDRTIMARVNDACDRRLIFLSLSKLKHYDKKVFVSPELTTSEFEKENLLLQQRRVMINGGAEPSSIRLRNLVLEKKINKVWTSLPAPTEDTESESESK